MSRQRAARASSPGGTCGAPGGQQQAGQRIGGVDRPLSLCVGVQGQEELPVREAYGQLVGGVDRKGGLADPRHPVDRVNAHHPAVRCHLGQLSAIM